MDWYWILASFALASGAFYNAYEANKRVKQLEKRVSDLENRDK